MFTLRMLILFVAVSLIGCTPSVEPQVSENTTAATLSTRIEPQLDAILAQTYAADEPGVVVVASRKGQVVYQAARGMADLELDVALQPKHVLKIGSITKQFTAAAILRLAEQSKLTMQSKVGEILPNFHEPDLTIHQLLNHTSGLPSYTDDGDYMMGEAIRADVDAAEIIALTSDQPLHFVPGTDWRYSNSGYVVLGAIIEKLSGMSWHEYIAKELTQPLQLTNTGYFNAAELVEGRVPGYMYDEDYTNAPYISMTQPHAAGAMYSTAAELDRWQHALHTGQVLTDESYAQMIDASQGLNNYAYALDIISLRGTKMISHGGGIHGFSAFALWLPEYEVSVVALTNTMGRAMGASGTAFRIAARLIGKPFPIEKQSVAITETELQQLVGTYQVDESTQRTLFIKDGVLHSKRGEGRPYAARYVGDGQFVFADTLVYFEVVRDAEGNISGLNYYQLEEAEPEFSKKVSSEVKLRETGVAKQLNLLQGGQKMPAPRIDSSLNKEAE